MIPFANTKQNLEEKRTYDETNLYYPHCQAPRF